MFGNTVKLTNSSRSKVDDSNTHLSPARPLVPAL